jgi:hypothetical protein
VQQRGVERDELLALEAGEQIRGRLGEVEQSELFGDRVQAPERAAVVVFVVALDELQRKAVQQPGTTEDRCELITHVSASCNTLKTRRPGEIALGCGH